MSTVSTDSKTRPGELRPGSRPRLRHHPQAAPVQPDDVVLPVTKNTPSAVTLQPTCCRVTMRARPVRRLRLGGDRTRHTPCWSGRVKYSHCPSAEGCAAIAFAITDRGDARASDAATLHTFHPPSTAGRRRARRCRRSTSTGATSVAAVDVSCVICAVVDVDHCDVDRGCSARQVDHAAAIGRPASVSFTAPRSRCVSCRASAPSRLAIHSS